jgi:hypothetical protein
MRNRKNIALALALTLCSVAAQAQTYTPPAFTPATPVAIGNTTPNTGAFTSLSAVNGSVNATSAGGVALKVTGVGGQFAQVNYGGASSSGSGLDVQGTFTGTGTTNLVRFMDTGNTNGVNLLMVGNGSTTINKYLRVQSGVFQIINSTYSSTILSLTDAGVLKSPAILANSPTAGALGYATGSAVGAAVTQTVSRATGVTINNPTGTITLVSAAGSATPATFTVTNSTVAATDTVILSVQSSTNTYMTSVTKVSAGSFNVTFYTTGGTAVDAPLINFAIIKGANN